MFCENLTKILKERSISQYRLSRDTLVSQGALSDYLSGKREPSAKNLQKIAEYLNVSVDFLLGRNASDDGDPISRRQLKYALEDPEMTDEGLSDILAYAKFKKEQREKDKK